MPRWENTRGVDRRFLLIILVPTLMGLGHHLDHVIRGNHVGWPVTPEVTPFTFTLLIYPVILGTLWLSARDRAGVGAWFWVAVGGLAMLAATHLGPWALEPPADIIGPYRPSSLGYVAFAWMLGLLASLAFAAGFAAWRWRALRS